MNGVEKVILNGNDIIEKRIKLESDGSVNEIIVVM